MRERNRPGLVVKQELTRLAHFPMKGRKSTPFVAREDPSLAVNVGR